MGPAIAWVKQRNAPKLTLAARAAQCRPFLRRRPTTGTRCWGPTAAWLSASDALLRRARRR